VYTGKIEEIQQFDAEKKDVYKQVTQNYHIRIHTTNKQKLLIEEERTE
jgi:uncharacterized pyridoxamine 5'-phosphate oxidase family protein